MTKAGFIALIGEPNAGKSTLMNAMVGAKIAIVTHKVQTTRTMVRGIAMEGDAQLIFVDTPGLFRPRRRLDRAMVAAAWSGAEDADIVALLIEAHRGLTDGVREIIAALKDAKRRPTFLVINKIDKVKPEALLALSKKMNEAFDFDVSFMISAETGKGVDSLRSAFAKTLPASPWLYPEDQIADMPLRLIAAEITREKLMLRLHEELPYQLTVETESWEERKDGSVKIIQLIYVARDGHKGIVLGRRGETLKGVSMAARKELSAFLDRKVHLFLEVKVRENWQDEKERYEELGLEFDPK